jgi:site-specific DNA-cytosine methylase
VAWHPLGWKAAWLSEIEPFPSAVLAHHYPDVPNLGDMTALPERIQSGEIEAPDVFCGGTPCQAFSVAGLRNSLDDARGNLSLTFVGIANAIDHVRSVRGESASIVFWENVPGVLSTKDNAFGCFLGALAGEDDPIIPPGEKWTNAGCVYGPQRTVAWRVLDAQYFGVAQRRRRVFVVASARNDFDPAAVLFEFDSVRRDSAPSREAREGIAGGIGDGASKRSWPAEVSSTLDTTFGTKQGPEDQHVNAECPLFVLASTVQTLRTRRPGEGGMSGDDEHLVPVISPALNTCSGSHHAPDTKAYVVEPISIHPHWIGRAPEAGPTRNQLAGAVMQPFAVANCLTARMHKGINSTLDEGQTPVITQVMGETPCAFCGHPFDQETLGRYGCPNCEGEGLDEPIATTQFGDPSFTLTKGRSHAVAQPVNIYGGNKRPDRPEGGFYVRMDEDTTKTLDAASGLNPTCSQGGTAVMQPVGVTIHGTDPTVQKVASYDELAQCLRARTPGNIDNSSTTVVQQPIAFHRTQDPISSADGTTHGLGCGSSGGQASVAVAIGLDQELNGRVELAGTLQRKGEGGFTGSVMTPAMAVRRLTPVECERLQGFPMVSERITIEACLDHQNQSVHAVLKCRRWQNSAWPADESELRQHARTAGVVFSTLQASQEPLAALHVRMHSVDELLEVRSLGKLIWSANGAASSSKCRPHTLTESTVQELARLQREVARTVTDGKVESPLSISLSFLASSGATSAEKSGQETRANASDATSGQSLGTFTTSDLGRFTTFSDSTAEILFCSVLRAIAGCIPSETLPATFLIELTVETPYTAIPWRKKPASECPDGPRYKALGNSWAVPNVRWIGKRIQEALNALP